MYIHHYPNCPGRVLAKGAFVVREVTSQHDTYHKCPLTARIYSKRNDSPRTQPFRHVTAIFAAGHDSSTNVIAWILFLLSQHPDITADLIDELDSVLHGEAPTVEQLQKLPLLDRVVKEGMRVLTAIPWNGRVTSQPTTLGGYELPVGTNGTYLSVRSRGERIGLVGCALCLWRFTRSAPT